MFNKVKLRVANTYNHCLKVDETLGLDNQNSNTYVLKV